MSDPLQQHLQQLREQLAQNSPLTDEERAQLATLLQEIEMQLARDTGQAPDETLVDSLNLAMERFEIGHPALAGTLRNILQSLANMGI